MDEQPQQIAQEQQEHQAPPAQAEQLVEAEAAPVEQQAAAPVKQEEQQQQQPEEPASVQEQQPVEPVKQEQEAAPVSETAQDVSMPQQTEEAAPAEAVALYDPEPAAVADEEPKRDRSRSRSPRRTFGAEGSRIEDSYRAGRDYDRPSQTARSRSPPRQFDGYRYQDPSAMPPSAPPAVIPGTFNPRPGGAAFNAPVDEAAEHAKHSIKENRVYVGNLSYDVRYKDLEQFMTDAGLGVVFTEILLTPQGLSKGCGIIEFASREDAQRAINEFSDKQLLGRPVFIREDREQAAKFGAPPSVGARAMMGGGGFGGGGGMGGNKLYIGNLPYQVGWQDLKDLFRPAGSIIRADIQTLPDGRPKGSGIVIFESPVDAANAIHQFNGFMWGDRRIEVREDRFAGPGGFRGGFRGGMGGGGHMGHMGGGHMGGGYPGGGHMGGPPPFRGGGGYGAPPYGGGPGFGGSPHGGQSGFGGSAPGGFGGPAAGGFGGGAGGYQQANPESTQILVTNLPWSTSNEDLVELFETTGEVVAAEVLLEPNGRSRGVGVCEFVAVEQATSAIAKFTGYVYGGRALGLSYISRPHPFTPTAARSSA